MKKNVLEYVNFSFFVILVIILFEFLTVTEVIFVKYAEMVFVLKHGLLGQAVQPTAWDLKQEPVKVETNAHRVEV